MSLPALPRPESVVAGLLPDGVPVLRDAVRERIADVFGPPPIREDPGAGDPGLFGPGSASWVLLADPAAIVGGVRGLMFQTMHPGSMAGVHDHSAFAHDPLGRLQRTTQWVITSAFGTAAEVTAAARRVRGVHPRVQGMTPGGRPYRADDPHLLAWVQCALTDGFLATDAAYAATPLDASARDAFVREQSTVAGLLDPRVDLERLDLVGLARGEAELPMIAEGRLPTTVAGLAACLDGFRWELEVGAQAREALDYLKAPPLPALLRAAYLAVWVGAAATFDTGQRRRLGLRLPVPVAAAQAATRMHVAALRTVAGRSATIVRAEARAA